MSDTDRKIIKTANFSPDNYEEGQIKRIAEVIGEKDLTFLLSVKRTHGFHLIEDAYNILKEQQRKTKIVNIPAYLNKIIQNLKEN